MGRENITAETMSVSNRCGIVLVADVRGSGITHQQASLICYVFGRGTDSRKEGKVDIHALETVEALRGKDILFEREVLRSKRLLSSVIRGVESSEMLQVLGPDTGRLDEVMTAVHLQDLAEFRDQPKYQVICFTFAEGARPDRTLIPCFQYCRLLLASSGRLAVLLPDAGQGGRRRALSAFFPVSRYAARKSYPADLLRAAGFKEVRLCVRAGEGRVVLGRRPDSPWRDKRLI